MKEPIYMADFETIEDNNCTRVWCWYICEIGNLGNNARGTDIASFIDHIQAKGITKCYFHNLKFDGQYIMDYLLKNGFTIDTGRTKHDNTVRPVISDEGMWYMVELCFNKPHGKHKKWFCCSFLDSLKLMPFSVAELSRAFGLEMSKGEIDYNMERPIDYEPTTKEWAYVIRDVEIVAECLRFMFDDNCNKMTAGACSLAYYKETVGGEEGFRKLFPILDKDTDTAIRKAYRGGYTYLNPINANIMHKDGIVLDVNSMYPWAMKYKPMPLGRPEKFYGEPDIKNNKWYGKCEVLYVVRIKIIHADVKDNHIPTLQAKNSFRYNETEYLSEIDDLEVTLTNIDLQLFLEHYDAEIEYYDGYFFQSKIGLFDSHIDHFMEIKKATKGAKRTIAKLMLNSLYGKFGTNPHRGKKIPALDNDKIVYREVEYFDTKPVYCPVAVFTTAYARDNIIRNAQKAYDRFIYCDTDSLHLQGMEIPVGITVDPLELGAYKLESTFTKSYFIRSKTYLEEIDGEIEVKCAGMPKNVTSQVTFENFRSGTVFHGKLLPKSINGGCALHECDFTIK